MMIEFSVERTKIEKLEKRNKELQISNEKLREKVKDLEQKVVPLIPRP